MPHTRMPQADRRRQIIDEAVAVVGRRGYYGFSLAEVAGRCGLTVAGVLHHVGTKDGLLVAVLEDRDRRDLAAAQALSAVTAETATSRPEALAFLRAFVVRNSTQPELVRLYSMLRVESLYPGHPAHEYFGARDERVLSTFTRLVRGLVEEPASTARQLLALMGGLEEQWLRTPDDVDLVAEWDRAVARVLPPAP